MVLAELGSKIQSALAKMGQATVIDEKVLDDLVRRHCLPQSTQLSLLLLSSLSPVTLLFPSLSVRSRPSRLRCCRPTWTCSW